MQDSTPVGAQPEGGLFPVSAQVLACNYWLLAADAAAPERYLAWFQADGGTLPVVEAFKNKDELKNSSAAMQGISPSMRPITHYLLLAPSGAPLQETLSGLLPWISENRPTIGFSIEEAALAARVSIHDSAEMFSEELIDSLRSAGCTVQRLDGNGTSIAPSTASNQPLPMRGEP